MIKWSKLRLTHCYLITSKIIDNVEESTKSDSSQIVFSGSIVAVAAYDSSPDTFWFIMISESEKEDDSDVRDGYGNIIPAGSPYITGY